MTVACTQDSSPHAPAPAARAEGLSAPPLSDSPFLVADLHTTPEQAYTSVSGLTAMGDAAFFINRDGIHGSELWRTDGTREGTRLVRDIFPGGQGASISALVALEGRLYFTAEDHFRQYGLWSSDGTAEGTLPLQFFGDRPEFLISLGDTLLFMARTVELPSSWGLWKSDGTAAGTVPVKLQLNLGTNYVGYTYPARLGNQVLFASFDLEHGAELWSTDGTPEGTRLLKDLRPGKADSHPTAFARLGGMLLFWARSDSDNFDLWRTDGTPEGTVRLKAIRQSQPGNSPFPTKLVSTGDAIYFSAWDAEHGQELWRSDGTAEGTHLVADIRPGQVGSEPRSLTKAGNTLFFSASDEATGREPWRTDGTAEGTVRIKDLSPGTGWSLYYHDRFIASPEGTVFFMAGDGTSGYHLWKSGGTEADTVLVTNELPNMPGEVVVSSWAHGRLYLYTNRGELWTSDGTAEGTRPVATLARKQPGSAPRWPVNMNGTLFFAANDGLHGEELWMSDGTLEGSRRVTNIARGDESAYPSHLTPLNGQLLFLSGQWEGNASSFSLWRIDGTGEGLTSLATISKVYDSPSLLVRMGDEVFFTQYTWLTHDHALWKTDGTREGTVLVKAVTGPQLGWEPMHLTAVGNRLFFVAESGVGRQLLWTSDGTGPGTSMVTDVGSGDFTSFKHLVAVGDTLYFWVITRTRGYELWKSDGTAANTLPLMRVSGEIGPALATPVGNTLFFITQAGTSQAPELWKTDGNDPVRLEVFHAPPYGPAPTFLTAMKGALYFWANDGVHGYEPWTSDGTAEGTRMLEDIAPGAASAVGKPGPFVLAGPEGPLLFAASDGVSGLEPWQTDGTPEGTVRVADLAPGVASSSPAWMATAGRYLFFQADDSAVGAELWALPRTVTDTTPPLLTCPVAPPAVEATSPAGARVRYPAATAADDSSRPVVRYKPLPDTDFPLGTTPVSVTALDDIGNRATCTFDVTVRDTTPPTLTCPAGLRTEATGPAGATVDYPAATATDATSVPSVRYSQEAGSTFPLGETQVEASATDGAGLTTTCTFTVRVADTRAPTLACPPSSTVEATRPEGAVVGFTRPAAYDTVSTTEVELSHAPGLFPLGLTEVKATTRDSSGNSSQCSFSVWVRDTTAPSLTCPGTQRVVTSDPLGRKVSFPPSTARDDVSAVEVEYSLPSGSWFPPGDTLVTVTATDASENRRSCTFQVHVEYKPRASNGPSTPPPPPPPPGEETAQGCGCQSGGGSVSGVLGLALLGAFTRRRRAPPTQPRV